MLNTGVVVPMPSESVSTATAVKPGFFRSWRKANFRSFITQCLQGIDFGRSARRQPAGQQCDSSEQYCHAHKCSRVGWFHVEKECPQDVRECDGNASPHNQPNKDQLQGLAENQANDLVSLSADCYSNCNLSSAGADRE